MRCQTQRLKWVRRHAPWCAMLDEEDAAPARRYERIGALGRFAESGSASYDTSIILIIHTIVGFRGAERLRA